MRYLKKQNNIKREEKLNALIKYFNKRIYRWKKNNISNEISFVYNHFLNNIKWDSLKYIIVGDNPGSDESANNKYFYGEAGMIARSFFDAYLVNDFDTEVLMLNKTPIYSSQTKKLENLDNDYEEVLVETQKIMACLTYRLHKELQIPLFIMGYSEYKTKSKVGWLLTRGDNSRPLVYYFKKIKELYSRKNYNNDLEKMVYFIHHFSMGNFYKHFSYDDLFGDIEENLKKIGINNKSNFFHF